MASGGAPSVLFSDQTRGGGAPTKQVATKSRARMRSHRAPHVKLGGSLGPQVDAIEVRVAR